MYSSQNKRQPSKKLYPDRPTNANLPTTSDEDSDTENFSSNGITSLKDTADNLDITVEDEQTETFPNNGITSFEDDVQVIDFATEAEQSNDSMSLTKLNEIRPEVPTLLLT